MFREKISKLQQKFKEHGPGAEGAVLEAGAEAVKKFTETLAKYLPLRFPLSPPISFLFGRFLMSYL